MSEVVTRRRGTGRWRTALAVAGCIAALVAGGCAHVAVPRDTTGIAWRAAPQPDSVTLGLWHLDEASGARLGDSGPQRLDGSYGLDTQPKFGRFFNGRTFISSMNSFAIVSPDPALDFGDTWSVEVWINPANYSPVECSVVVGRWNTSANEQSWWLGLTGQGRVVVPGAPVAPAWFTNVLGPRTVGLLAFVLQPESASQPKAFVSTVPVSLNRWTHVAVTHDGSALRIYLDGRLDAQFVTSDRVRRTPTSLVLGNIIDPRWLTESAGSVRVLDRADLYPFYAFDGIIDELRISSGVRTP